DQSLYIARMHNHSETVSVLIPVYNGATYLEAAIESIRRQTHRDFEFIIVDDGSTDGSGELLQRIAPQDSRIRVVRGTHEGGVAARNRGLALARAQSSSAWMRTTSRCPNASNGN